MKRLLATLESLGYTRILKKEHHSLDDLEYAVLEGSDGTREVMLGKGAFGYIGFGCIFHFDAKGKCLGHGAIE